MFYFYNKRPYTYKYGLVIVAEPSIMYIQYHRFFITWFRCGDEYYKTLESTDITCIYVSLPHSYDVKYMWCLILPLCNVWSMKPIEILTFISKQKPKF